MLIKVQHIKKGFFWKDRVNTFFAFEPKEQMTRHTKVSNSRAMPGKRCRSAELDRIYLKLWNGANDHGISQYIAKTNIRVRA